MKFNFVAIFLSEFLGFTLISFSSPTLEIINSTDLQQNPKNK